LLLVAAVVGVSIVTKFFSGWLGGKIIGFNNSDASIIGLATVPQLSTTLAVVFTAVETGLLGQELITAMVILSIVTTLVAPIGLRLIASNKKTKET
jgi:Kef-type K+ transport system membrane component KefB